LRRGFGMVKARGAMQLDAAQRPRRSGGRSSVRIPTRNVSGRPEVLANTTGHVEDESALQPCMWTARNVGPLTSWSRWP